VAVSSCSGGGGRGSSQYGKVIAKTSDERKAIEIVQNTRLGYNENITFKEAVALNKYSTNISWEAFPARMKGAWIVEVRYDIPVDDFFTSQRYTQEGKAATPIGEANMVSALLGFGEYASENLNYFNEDRDTLVKIANDYVRYYAERFLDDNLLPEFDDLINFPDNWREYNKPFFNTKKGTFVGELFYNPADKTVEFVRYGVFATFTTPYITDLTLPSGAPSDEREYTAGLREDNAHYGLKYIYDDANFVDDHFDWFLVGPTGIWFDLYQATTEIEARRKNQ
jgi:hypothetical protein